MLRFTQGAILGALVTVVIVILDDMLDGLDRRLGLAPQKHPPRLP